MLPLPQAPSAAEDDRIPDLLHPVARSRVDVDALRLGIQLAFSSGVSGGLFHDALERAAVDSSTWDPAAFEADLFLASFVAGCFRVRIGGQEPVLCARHVARVLRSPPVDPSVAQHRRAILAELATDGALRAETEHLYTTLCKLRSLIEGATGAAKWDPARRQLEILALVKDVIDRMADGFRPARSGLARLSACARRVRADEPYRSLADLLRYDEQMGTVDVRVTVGADGRIRNFAIVALAEPSDTVFASSPVRRWLAKAELFLRGYRFGDGEVMARLIDAVFDGIEGEVVHFVQLLGDLEVYLGALGFRDLALAAGLAVSLPEIVPAGSPRAVRGLWNPLLLAHGVRVVPCDVITDRHDTTVLVTGPNSGGKTRLLQSLGLTQLLAQGGFFIPAASGSVAAATGMVVSLIEETRADQAEGRLGTELLRIRALFERLPPGAMVILDELCSGTNPSEGEEIFELVLRMLSRLRPQALITTHFLAFAAQLERESAIGSLRFLQVELSDDQRPTYQFVPGVARTSLAGHAAARLGVTGEQLMALIDQNLAHAAARDAVYC